MKIKPYLIPASLLAVALLPLPAAHAQTANYAYTINNGAASITKFSGTATAVTIPAMLGGLPVTSITGVTNIMVYPSYPEYYTNITVVGAFQGSNVNIVTIPASVAFIGAQAFQNCQALDELFFLGSAPTLDNSGVFSGDNFAQVFYLPGTANWGPTLGSLTTLLAQFGCTANADGSLTITNSTFPDVPTFSSGEPVFQTLNIPATLNGRAVTAIGPGAFQNTQWSFVVISNGLTCIGTNAFNNDRYLYAVTLPGSVTNIEDGAFQGCGLAEVTLANGLKNIGNSAFSGCPIHSLTIPATVTNIGAGAFSYSPEYLQPGFSLAINDSMLISIGAGAFEESSLASVSIPDSVTTIGDSAFAYCPNLKKVTIGKGIKDIGGDWFDLDPLTSITIGNGVTNIESGAFDNFSGAYSISNIYFLGNAPTYSAGSFYTTPPISTTVFYLPNTTGWGPTYDGFPAVLWNPAIPVDASFGVYQGRFGFNVTGTAGLVITLQASTDGMASWFNVETQTLTGGKVYFSDGNWKNYPGAVYRLTSD